MTDKQKKVRRKDKDSDAIIYTFIATVVVLCILVFIYKLFSRGNTMIQTLNVLGVLRWIFLGLTLVLVVLAVYRRRTGRKNPFFRLSIISLATGLSCWLMAAYFLNGVKFLCGFYVVAAVVYLIWLIYKAEFFTVCALIAVTGLSLWIMLMAPGSVAAYLALGVGLVCCALQESLVLSCRKGQGKLKLKGEPRRLYSARVVYGPMIACAPVSAAALIVGVLGTTFAYYCIIAMVCVAFVYAVYYTVKLM